MEHVISSICGRIHRGKSRWPTAMFGALLSECQYLQLSTTKVIWIDSPQVGPRLHRSADALLLLFFTAGEGSSCTKACSWGMIPHLIHWSSMEFNSGSYLKSMDVPQDDPKARCRVAWDSLPNHVSGAALTKYLTSRHCALLNHMVIIRVSNCAVQDGLQYQFNYNWVANSKTSHSFVFGL